jgi:hypothetical protein
MISRKTFTPVRNMSFAYACTIFPGASLAVALSGQNTWSILI